MRRTPPESRGVASSPSTAGRQLARRRRAASAERRVRRSRGDRYPSGGKGGGVNLGRSLDKEAGVGDTSARDVLDKVEEADSGEGGWAESDSDREVEQLVGVDTGAHSPIPSPTQSSPAPAANAVMPACPASPVEMNAHVDDRGLDKYEDDSDDEPLAGMQDSNIIWGNDVNKNCEAILEFCESNGCSRDNNYSRAQHAMNQRNGIISMLDDQAEMVADFLRLCKTNNRLPATLEPERPAKAWLVTPDTVEVMGDLDIVGADGVVIADPVANEQNIVMQPASIAHICDVLGEEFHKRHHVS